MAQRPSSAGYERPRGAEAGAVSWDNWLAQSRDVAGDGIRSQDEEAERISRQDVEKQQAVAEGEANKLLQSAELQSASGRFPEAREAVQRARMALRKANIGREPSLRRLEAKIKQDESQWVRRSAEEALEKAEEFYLQRQVDQAREMVAVARRAFNRCSADAADGCEDGFSRLKSLDSKIQTAAWAGHEPLAADPRELASVKPSGGAKQGDSLRKTDLEIAKQGKVARVDSGSVWGVGSATRGKLSGFFKSGGAYVKNGLGATFGSSLKFSRALGRARKDTPNVTAKRVVPVSEETKGSEELVTFGLQSLHDCQQHLLNEDIARSRERLKAAREALGQGGRLEEHAGALREAQRKIDELQQRRERRNEQAWLEKNEEERRQFEKDFAEKQAKGATGAELTEAVQKRKAAEEQAAHAAMETFQRSRQASLPSLHRADDWGIQPAPAPSPASLHPAQPDDPSLPMDHSSLPVPVSSKRRYSASDAQLPAPPRGLKAPVTVVEQANTAQTPEGRRASVGVLDRQQSKLINVVGERVSADTSRRLIIYLVIGGFFCTILFITLASLHLI